jgi:hypothetical protein
MTRLVRAVAAVVAALVAAAAMPLPAHAQSPSPTERPDRLLLLSLPGVTWADLQDHDLPNIERLLADSAVADLAPRAVVPRPGPGAAYLTISSGSRATSDEDVDGQQLATDDESAGSTAGEIFHRRTGTAPDGDYVALAWPTLLRVNKAQPYDAVMGLLGSRLATADRGVAVIGNADGTDTIGPSYERQVGLAGVTKEGLIAAGDLSDRLVVDDPSSPFGRRLDPEAVTDAFRRAWRAPAGKEGGLVVVEGSDLARTMRYRDRVEKARYDDLWADALASTDELVGRLLQEVDLDRDAVLVVAPYNLPRDRDLMVAGLHTPAVRSGYLRSASTQRSGFLTLVDLAPTILDRLDLARPEDMEGRPAELVRSSDSYEQRVDRLVTLNRASRFREHTLFPTTMVAVLLLAVVCAAAAVVLARGAGPGWRRAVTWLALVDVAILPLSYLARFFPLEDLGYGFYWGFVIAGAVVVATGAMVVAQRLGRPRLALIAVLVLVLGVLVADVMTGSRLSLSAAFGYSPTGNSRLYGISNYSFGQVAASACLLAAFLAACRPQRRNRLLALALMGATLVVIGMPLWGSDVGGIIAFTPTILVFAALLGGWRISLRHLVVFGLVTVAAVTAFGFADLARPPEERAHLGRLFERIGHEGLRPLFDIMERKFLANLEVSTSSFWVAAIPIAVAFWIFLARYPGRPLDGVLARITTLRAGLAAAITAAVVGSLVNDSGLIVGGVTLLVVAVALAFLSLEPQPDREPQSATTEPEPDSATDAAVVAA